MLNKASINVRVENGVDMFRECWAQAIWAQLDRLGPRKSFDFKGAKGRFSAVEFRREGVRVVRGVSTSGVSREESVYAAGVHVRGISVLQGNERFVVL